jgi:hypothetical protein
MKETSEKAAQIRADLWLRLDRITLPLQLDRWAGNALYAVFTRPSGDLGAFKV